MYSLHYSDLGGGMGDDVARPFSSLDNGMGMDQQNEPMMKPQQNYLQRHEELLYGNDGNNQMNDGSGSLSRNDDLAVVRNINASVIVIDPTFVGNLTGIASTASNLTRNVIAGDGLTGGGELTADRTLNIGVGTGITVNAIRTPVATKGS